MIALKRLLSDLGIRSPGLSNILFLILATLTSFSALSQGRESSKNDELPPCCRKPSPAAGFSDKSIYLLESQWTADTGNTVQLGALKGRPQLVAMFFSSCEYACPILVEEMKQLHLRLPEAFQKQVDLLLISFDTTRDTPEKLAEYRKKNQLPVKNWSILTGNDDAVLELSAVLGVQYAKLQNGQFSHSNLITLLNAKGEVAAQFSGLDFSDDKWIQTVVEKLSK